MILTLFLSLHILKKTSLTEGKSRLRDLRVIQNRLTQPCVEIYSQKETFGLSSKMCQVPQISRTSGEKLSLNQIEENVLAEISLLRTPSQYFQEKYQD